jgi:hypothetical protein
MKVAKKPSRIEAKEEESVTKKKKITKERSGYKLTRHLRELMEVARYRDYRPDLIMVGPQFQAKIEESDLYKGNSCVNLDQKEWLQDLRESLQLRKHE